jgi:hypothetical protein
MFFSRPYEAVHTGGRAIAGAIFFFCRPYEAMHLAGRAIAAAVVSMGTIHHTGTCLSPGTHENHIQWAVPPSS